MEQTDLISVIIPVYQVEKYLERCLRSVTQQTYSNLEIILVDDGSTDQSGQICDDWVGKDKRIKVFHKKNEGQSVARNLGLSVATGDFIGFVDSDDWIVEDMYEYLMMLIKGEDADISMCGYTRDVGKLEKSTESAQVKILDNVGIQKFFYRVDGEISNYAVWNRLYRRELLEGIRFAEGKITEDVLISYEVFKKAKRMVLSDAKKYLYFKNNEGITRSKLQNKDIDLLEIWDEIVRREMGTEWYEWAWLNRLRATFTLYVKGIVYGCEKEFNKEYLKSWKQELKSNYVILSRSSIIRGFRKIALHVICVF